MADPRTLWRRFLDRPNDDTGKAIGIVTLTALGAAVLVSITALALEPRQQANREAARQARMAAMLDTLPGLRDVLQQQGATGLQTRIVDLETGAVLRGVDPAGFDAAAEAADPELGIALPPEADIAGLGRRARRAAVHLLERDGALLLVVLPVEGVGYQSRIRGLLALEPDLNTVAALAITEHGETPGIGARIDDPDWQALWPGREIADASGRIVIDVVRGTASGPYEVDGISGATRTGNGVADMVRFWMGPHGYGPVLDRLAREGAA